MVTDRQLEEGGEALFGPELSSTLEAVLELSALGCHGAASDGQARLGGTGIVQVGAMGLDIGVGVLEGGEPFRACPGRVGQQVSQGLEKSFR